MIGLSPTTTYLADANLFIKAGTPQRTASNALAAFFNREQWALLIHPAVEDELSAANRPYPRHRTLENALSDDWARVIALPKRYSVARNEIETAARECIAEQTNRAVAHIEETDVKLVSLAANLLEIGDATDVGIITNDQAAGVCFDTILDDFGYDRAEFIDADALLEQIVAWYTASSS